MGMMSVAANNMHAADIMRVEWTAELRHQTVEGDDLFRGQLQLPEIEIEHRSR